jgi:hypothetical protein
VGRQYNGYHLDDILVMKLAASDGDILWNDLYGGVDDQYDRGWTIAVGPDGNPVVTGITGNADGTANYLTRKLSNQDGSQIWVRSLPGAVNNIEERAGWLAVCDNGDMVMANRTWTTTTSYDVILHRYAASDGATVWTKQYNSSGTVADDPRSMVRDSAGDLLVVGVRAGDFMVLKFRQSDGSLAWSSGYNGPPGWYDTANCVAEGPNGEVIVSGFSTGGTTDWDVTTAAFAASDGVRSWVERFDSGDGLSDESAYLAVSAKGDLYVGGYGYDLVSGSDLLCLRYSLGAPAAVPETLDPSRFLTAGPNPFSTGVSFSIASPSASSARISIYDATGRRVTILGEGSWIVARGDLGRLTWDGRDQQGVPTAPGTYFVRAECGTESGTCTIVRIR